MRQTRIPAQITTVEDKIAGNLNFTQILLFLAALFIATAIYILFPTQLKLSIVKVSMILFTTIVCFTFAIRIKGRVILQWFFVITAFVLRPKYYVFNKNDMTTREVFIEERKKVVKHQKKAQQIVKEVKKASLSDLIAVEQVLLNPTKQVRFFFVKGGINVSVSEGK